VNEHLIGHTKSVGLLFEGSTMKGTKIMLGMLLSSSFSAQAFPISCRKKMLLSYRTAARTTTGLGSPPRAVAHERDDPPPLLLNEGIFAVEKPMNWTSSDVVSYLRVMLERDARDRGCSLGKNRRRPAIKVGHGGTLDPLATGVLVIGVGKGTKEMDGYVLFMVLAGGAALRVNGLLIAMILLTISRSLFYFFVWLTGI
jgi:hypothetical protein